MFKSYAENKRFSVSLKFDNSTRPAFEKKKKKGQKEKEA